MLTSMNVSDEKFSVSASAETEQQPEDLVHLLEAIKTYASRCTTFTLIANQKPKSQNHVL